MRGVSFWFFFSATIYVLLGMVWGIQMAVTQDHANFPAHAHLNLVGWVTMALFGTYYHVVPGSGQRPLAKVHFGVATLGLLIMVPGIFLVLQGYTDKIAATGAILSLTSMLIFSFTVWRDRKA